MKSYESNELKQFISANNANWVRNLKSLGLLGFRSYKLRCPVCNQNGIPFPRWKKGNKNQPLFITHRNGNSIKRICEIPHNEINGLNRSLKISNHDLFKLFQFDNAFVLFSGGKDSLCTLDYLNDLVKQNGDKLKAVYVDTTCGFPEVEKYVRKVCKSFRVSLKIVKPEIDYYTLAKKWGIPNFKSRWCCRELKINPIKQYFSELKGSKVVFDGIRAAESNDRATYFPIWYHPGFDALSVSPNYFWSDEDVEEYINKRGLPRSPVYKYGTSSECWCGAYKRISDFKMLFKLHPEIFEQLVEIEKLNSRGFTYIYKKGKRIPLERLKKELLENKQNRS